MKNLKIFSSAIAMLFCIVALGQEKVVSGTVSDASGPLPGANVLVKGTTRGTQTDFDGKYSIKAKEGETLVFSFVGMKSKEINVGKSSIINVKLEDNSSKLEEVIVVGYATSTKERYTNTALRKVKSKVNGIQVAANSGNIKIRGYASSIVEDKISNPNYPSNRDTVLPNVNNEDYETFVDL